MNTSGVKPGDLVECDVRGQQFVAKVTEKKNGTLLLDPVVPSVSYRSAKPREVVAHYRKSKASLR